MNIFVDDILKYKRGDLFKTLDNELEFSPFIIQRILSMSNPFTCFIVNKTTNKKLSTLTKKQLYSLWVNIIPKNLNHIQYFKRSKKVTLTDADEQVVHFLSQKHRISQRDVIDYINAFNINTEEIRKIFKK